MAKGSQCHWCHVSLGDLESSRSDLYPSSAVWWYACGKDALSPSLLATYGGQESCRASLVPHQSLRAGPVPYLRNIPELLAGDVSGDLVLWTRDQKRGACPLLLMLCGVMGEENIPPTLHSLPTSTGMTREKKNWPCPSLTAAGGHVGHIPCLGKAVELALVVWVQESRP